MRHLADIGIYAIMLAHLTQCVLSMLSICRCVYAHMTITHILQLVLPLPAARPAALLRPCSRVPAHAESSSSCLLRAAGMHISIVLVNVITPTSSLIAAAALLAHSHTHREHAAVAGSTHRTGGSMLLRSDAVKNKSRARTATNTWMDYAESHTCTGSLDMCTHNIHNIMITHRSPWRTRHICR